MRVSRTLRVFTTLTVCTSASQAFCGAALSRVRCFLTTGLRSLRSGEEDHRGECNSRGCAPRKHTSTQHCCRCFLRAEPVAVRFLFSLLLPSFPFSYPVLTFPFPFPPPLSVSLTFSSTSCFLPQPRDQPFLREALVPYTGECRQKLRSVY